MKTLLAIIDPYPPGRPRLRGFTAAVLALVHVMTVGCALRPTEAREGPVEVTEASIQALQHALSTGRTTSVELVGAYLARIAAYDDAGPRLNTLIRVNPAALTEAAELDRERRRSGPRGPLHGIPIILKDNYDTADMPTSGATLALATHQPSQDAFQVRKLRDAGAIILGKANLHELAYGITTVSSLGGQTLNPYALDRNPGGSSGGTAAAIAASFAAVGWGTDTCGSIRIPAAANNLFGLRPTKGLSSITGILPLAHTQDVGGPLARTMLDLAIALDATIGYDEEDPATHIVGPMPLPRFVARTDQPLDLSTIRIGVLLDYLGNSESEEATNRLVREALAKLAARGAQLVDVRIPGFQELLSGTSVIDLEFKWDLNDYLARTPGAPVQSLTQIVERGTHHPAVDGVLRRADRHLQRDPEGYPQALVKRGAAADSVRAFMDRNNLDVLAYPPLRQPPALIGQPAAGNNCQLSAATGFPALSMPAGFTADGVPVGVELLGRAFEDETLIAIGFAYEEIARPRRAPGTTPSLRP